MNPPIDPAIEALKDRAGATVAVIAYLALAMVVPGIVVLSADAFGSSIDDWLTDVRPVVYLEGDVSAQRAESLRREVAGWGAVDGARLRSPSEAAEEVRGRLGSERAGALGLRDDWFPRSVVVSLGGLSAGRADIAARVTALEAREPVSSVDVPPARAVRAVAYLEWGWWVGGLLIVVLVGGAAVELDRYLAHLRSRESERLVALERLGAPAELLGRRPRVRGAVIGGWAGVSAAVLLSLCGAIVGVVAADLAPGLPRGGAGVRWMVCLSPLLLGPALGAGVGYWGARRRLRSDGEDASDGLRSALRHE